MVRAFSDSVFGPSMMPFLCALYLTRCTRWQRYRNLA